MCEGFNSQGLGYLESPIRSVYEEFQKAHLTEHFELSAYRFSEHHGELRLEIKDPDGHMHRNSIQFHPGIDIVGEVRKFLEVTAENWAGQFPAE